MFKKRQKLELIPVLPKNYRSIALAAIELAADPIVLQDGKRVTDFSEDGKLTQKGMRASSNFEIKDGETPILGFHDHPNEMWIFKEHEGFINKCASYGWLEVQGTDSLSGL